MNRNTVRWIIAALMLVALALGLSSPSTAEEAAGKLPMDFRLGGYPPKADGWTVEKEKDVLVSAVYEDPTISVSIKRSMIENPVKGAKDKEIEAYVARIRIADVTQLRTAASNDNYKKGASDPESMARDKMAVIAMNGDFFKGGNRDAGYLVRQGELIRDYTGNKRKVIFDMLLIDSEGDLHVVPSAVTENIESYINETLTPQGCTVLHTFNLGPALILNGDVQDISTSEAARQGEYQWCYPQQRIALVQTGHLEYAIVEVYGRTDSTAGMSLQQFAEYIAEQCPDAVIAYNLDGGGSTNLIYTWLNESAKAVAASYDDLYYELIHEDEAGSKKTKEMKKMRNQLVKSWRCVAPGHRDIHDLIYFASAFNSFQQ